MEGCIYGTVVGELERCGVVVDLADVVAFAKDAVTPRGNAGFFGGVVSVGADVIFVGGQEGDAGFGVIGEGEAGDHLEVELGN